MTSKTQIEANRRNARKSTDPTSERGKEKVAGNALRHGLRAEKLVCFDEAEERRRSGRSKARLRFPNKANFCRGIRAPADRSRR